MLDAAISSLMVTPTVPAEGQNVTATATATGTGQLVFNWSVTDTETGNLIDSDTIAGVDPNEPVNFNFVLPDDTAQMEHVYELLLTVTDADMSEAESMVNVQVTNVAPVLMAGPNRMVNEGQLLNLSNVSAPPLALFVDEGKFDTHTATIDWGDGSPVVNATVFFSDGSGALGGTHVYADDGVYTVTVTIMDDDGGSDTDSFKVTVKNLPPVLVFAGDQMVNEGQLLNLSNISAPPLGLFIDEGKLDTHTATIDWGDGSPLDNASVFFSNGSGALGGTHSYSDNGIYTVTVIVTDDNGGSDSRTFDVTVKNVAPTLINIAGDTIDENGIAMIMATIVDPSLVDVFQVDVNWQDGATATITGLGAADASGTIGSTSFLWTAATRELKLSHRYLDDTPSGTSSDLYNVSLLVRDDDAGMTGPYTAPVTVNNVAPVLMTVPNQTINEGQLLNLTGSGGLPIALLIDEGTLDTHTATINWGDGSATEPATVVFVSGSGSLGGSHTYADNGTYTVTVSITDDDGGGDIESFRVTVRNVAPSATNTGSLAVDEGSAFTLSGLNVKLSDPGFDNPNNPISQPDGSAETFAVHMINWGDGTSSVPASAVMRVNGSPGTPTTAMFDHAAHTYADDGDYTVRVRVADDDMGAFTDSARFVTGVAGVDFVELTFTIHVNNVAPTLTSVVPSVTTINESEGVSFSAMFSDPGFDNPLNPNAAMAPSIIDPLRETFTYDIDWGDGRQTVSAVAVADANGSVGVPSTGAFNGTHVYADDGTYTVSVTIRDDNGGVHTRTFAVIVENVNPVFVPPLGGGSFEGDDVTSEGITIIRVGFEDPGFDNTANPSLAAPPSLTDTLHESFTHVISWGDGTVDAIHTYADTGVFTVTVTVSGPGGVEMFSFPGFDSTLQPVLTLVSGQAINDPLAVAEAFTYVVDWGDGNAQTITLLLRQPGSPLFNNGLTTVLAAERISGGENILTTGSFEVQHQYLGPPNPANPTAEIRIDVTIVDDNNGSVTDFIEVPNPGIEVINVAIDTTADVPRLDLTPSPTIQVFIDPQASISQSLQQTDAQVASSELTATSERYLELEVVAPDGMVISTHRIREEALNDLRAFFATLPDNHYRIYLVRTENSSRRLIMDVYVRRGRVIDPSDDSEGTRDLPPTSEGLQQLNTLPLEDNPLLEPVLEVPSDNATSVPAEDESAAGDADLNGLSDYSDERAVTSSEPLLPLRGSLRWVVPLAGFGLAAGCEGWSQRVQTAFEYADSRDWQRLRRAGRTAGRSNQE